MAKGQQRNPKREAVIEQIKQEAAQRIEAMEQQHKAEIAAVLRRFYGGETVSARTDTADARSNMLGLKNGPPAQHTFKKPGRFHDMELAFLNFPVFHVDHYIAVAFYAGKILNFYIYVCVFLCHFHLL